MRPTLIIAIIALVSSLVAIAVAALSRHKKSSAGDIKLIGETGLVDSTLDPEGTVIVGGELWRARSRGGNGISPRTRVRVVGLEGHLALVEVCDQVQ